MKSFNHVLENRRSANKFLPNYPISEQELNSIFEASAFAPSCFNLQHTKYYAGITEGSIDAMHEASGQYKVSTGSGVIIVTGDKNAYQKAGNIYEGSKFLGIIDEKEYEYIISSISEFHESRDTQFLTDEAIRNASLSAMVFMLAAKDKGWDTCPMIFFDSDKVREYFSIPREEEIVMMIAIGKMDETSMRIRGYRKPTYEFVTYK